MGAAGGWKTHLIPFYCNSGWSILSSFQRAIDSFNSLLAPTKLGPLSDQISSGGPLLLSNWWRIIMRSYVSSEGVASKCTARFVRHVNKHPHYFTVPQPHLTVSGPNKSTPVKVNGDWYASSLALGSDPMNCSKGLAFILRHLMQLLTVFFIRPLPPIIQIILRSLHNVSFLSLWAADSC